MDSGVASFANLIEHCGRYARGGAVAITRESVRDSFDRTAELQAKRNQDAAISGRNVAGIAALVIRDEDFADPPIGEARGRHREFQARMFEAEGLGCAPSSAISASWGLRAELGKSFFHRCCSPERRALIVGLFSPVRLRQ